MNKYIKLLSTLFIIIIISVLTILALTNLNESYAADIVDRSELPNNDFTSNVTNNNRNNYILDALTANNSNSNYSNNFYVAQNFRTSDNNIPLYSLMKNLETPTTSETFEILDDNPSRISDTGILYILSHGFNINNTSNDIFSSNEYGAVSDNSIKQYITQIALWLYIYENKANFSSTYCNNGGCDFLENGGSTIVNSSNIRQLIKTCGDVIDYEYLNYIISLVDNAKDYSILNNSSLASISTDNITYHFNSDGSLLTTDIITPTPDSNSDNYLYYSIEIDDPNDYGVYIIDNEGERINNLSSLNGSFKVAVPLEDITKMDLTTIKITIKGSFIKDEGYSYRVTNSDDSLLNSNKTQKYTDVLLGYSPLEITSINFSLHNFVKISKIDITNSKELPGASLVIKNKESDEIIEKFVSTNTPTYFNLDDGNYTLCETRPPDGYELNTECIDFEVINSKISTVTMKNKPEEKKEIPNTGLFRGNNLYYLGVLLIVIGIVIITTIVEKRKKIESSN